MGRDGDHTGKRPLNEKMLRMFGKAGIPGMDTELAVQMARNGITRLLGLHH